ncbi:MAG: O-antigen ligase family protein [Bacteroidales bacterium]|nr:O-antigen ligase family protein [Bacteroidales bacterium]
MVKSLFYKKSDEPLHAYLYYLCLCLMLISLPTSIYFISVAQILMGANWLAEGQYREKIQRFLRNKPAVIFSLIYLVYLAGIAWTSDLAYGIGYDLKNKLPILTLTFLMASNQPLRPVRLRGLITVFSLTVLVTSIIGFIIFLSRDYINPRSISPFISHVYLSMMVVFSIFLIPWHTRQVAENPRWRKLSWLASAWLLLYLFILSSITGILCLGGVVVFLLTKEIFSKSTLSRKIMAVAAFAVMAAASLLLFMYVIRPLTIKITPEPLALTEKTSEGNAYRHDVENQQRENGHLVYHFIAEVEIDAAWNERSQIDIDSTDHSGQPIKATVYRYLSSKGLRKDKEGINALKEKDIEAIEHGIPNHLYTRWPNLLVRLHQSAWEFFEYNRTGNPSGHTFTQRLELWKGSIEAFKERPQFGWGTGDIFIAMDYGLSAIGSKLDNYQMKPHNQFLVLLLMVGITGTLVIFVLYIWFLRETRATNYLLFNIFLVIMLVSMLGNNPIDAQIGLTFFVFFSLYYGIMLPAKEKR